MEDCVLVIVLQLIHDCLSDKLGVDCRLSLYKKVSPRLQLASVLIKHKSCGLN